MHGVAPFGLRLLWVDEGMGHRVVLTGPADDALGVGSHVAFWSEQTGGVYLAQIGETARVDGMQFYRPAGGEWATEYAAAEVQGSVMFSLPFVGWLVRALLHPIGLMAFVGTPIVMLIVDVLQRAYLRFHRIPTNDPYGKDETAVQGIRSDIPEKDRSHQPSVHRDMLHAL